MAADEANSGRGGLLLLGVLGLLGGGLTLALTLPRRDGQQVVMLPAPGAAGPAPPPDVPIHPDHVPQGGASSAGAAPSGEPQGQAPAGEPPAVARDPGVGTGYDPSSGQIAGAGQAADPVLLAILDMQEPGTAVSYELLRREIIRDPVAVNATIQKYNETLLKLYQRAQAAGVVTAANAAQARDLMRDWQISKAVISTTEAIPIAGQIIKGVMTVIQPFIDAAAQATAEGRSLFEPRITVSETIFSGWKDGGYWLWDYPILSFTAPIFAHRWTVAGRGAFAKQNSALAQLAVTWPYGPVNVPLVSVNLAGEYEFRLVAGKPGGFPKLPDDEIAKNVYLFTVTDPQEVRYARPAAVQKTSGLGPELVPNTVPADLYAPWRGNRWLAPYIPKEHGGEGLAMPANLAGTPLENIQMCVGPEAMALVTATHLGRIGGPVPCKEG